MTADYRGLTAAEWTLLHKVNYGPHFDIDSLPVYANSEFYRPRGVTLTDDEMRAGLDACLAKGLLRVVDEAAVAEIVAELKAGGVLGPIYGLPYPGLIDYTPAGAELWNEGRVRDQYASTDVVRTRLSRYFRSEAAARKGMEDVLDPDTEVTVSGPHPVGPWRAQWWRRFPEGFRIDIEERCCWQGRCGGGDSIVLGRQEGADSGGLRRILDIHNVALEEWAVLRQMEWSPDYPDSFAASAASLARRWYGLGVTREGCRLALDACIRNGWLREVDEAAMAEVDALLRDEPAFMPLPSEGLPSRGHVGFTAGGATLYQMLSARWLGPAWEDHLSVEKHHYREEHRYCWTEEGLQGIAEGYAAEGNTIRASRLIPLGPWCVRWWDRYPSGYRLELEIVSS